MTVEARGMVAGLPAPLPPQTLRLDPGAGDAGRMGRRRARGNVATLGWDVEAGEAGGRHRSPARDAAGPPRGAGAHPASDARPVVAGGRRRCPSRAPADALPGRGGVAVRLAPTLTGGLGGVREWMRQLPVHLSRAARVARRGARRRRRLGRRHARHARVPGQDGLLEYFPTQDQGSEVLTAYVASLAHAAGRTLPADVLDGMLGALGRFVDGTLRRDSRMADLPLRRLAALEALARHGKATAAQVATIEATPALWPTSALLDWWSILSPRARRARSRSAARRRRGAAARTSRSLRHDAAVLERRHRTTSGGS